MGLEENLAALDAALRGDALAAARKLSKVLHANGIPHAIVGGIAVGAHGWARATRDVDVLVPSGTDLDEIVGDKGQPIRALDFNGRTVKMHGVAIDFLSPDSARTEFLDAAIPEATVAGGLPIIQLGPLVAMKLHAGRGKDETDVVEVLKAAGDFEATAATVRTYLAEAAPHFLEDFESLVVQARVEREQ